MKNINVLIIGGAGSLGYELCKLFYGQYRIFVVDISANDIMCLSRIFSNISIIKEDFRNTDRLLEIIEDNNIKHIINCAALKHVRFCEENIEEAIDTNILANLRIIKRTNKKDIGFIYISSDKSAAPSNIYAFTKQMMDYIIVKNNCKFVRGVNFFYSRGSVIDIWEQQYLNSQPFTLVKQECIRYFILISDMAKLVEETIQDTTLKTQFFPKNIFRVKIHDLFQAYLKCKNLKIEDVKINYFPIPDYEKDIENIDFETNVVAVKDINEIANILQPLLLRKISIK